MKIWMCDVFPRSKQVNMAASSREWDFEKSSVEYESETSAINYTRDSKSYEDQEYLFHVYMWLILYAVNYMSIINEKYFEWFV